MTSGMFFLFIFIFLYFICFLLQFGACVFRLISFAFIVFVLFAWANNERVYIFKACFW